MIPQAAVELVISLGAATELILANPLVLVDTGTSVLDQTLRLWYVQRLRLWAFRND